MPDKAYGGPSVISINYIGLTQLDARRPNELILDAVQGLFDPETCCFESGVEGPYRDT